MQRKDGHPGWFDLGSAGKGLGSLASPKQAWYGICPRQAPPCGPKGYSSSVQGCGFLVQVLGGRAALGSSPRRVRKRLPKEPTVKLSLAQVVIFPP